MLMFGRCTPEDVIIEAEHIECRQTCDKAHDPTHDRSKAERSRQNFIFTEESREGRNTGNCQTGDQESDMRNGQLFAQTAHAAHLVAVYGVDNRSGTQEEQRLEHGVRKQVEHTGHISGAVVSAITRHTKSDHHESDLGDRRESQHPFDIGLHTSDNRGKE